MCCARRELQRRHRQLFFVTCTALSGMVVTSGLATYALIQRQAAQRQTVRAEAEAETAKQTTSFLVDLFRISDPSEARGNSITAREMLDKGAARIDRELAQQPAIRATLMDTVGTVYMGLGLYPQARPLLDGAVATRRGSNPADPHALSLSLDHLGDLLRVQAQYDAAEKAYREAITIQAPARMTPRAAPNWPRASTDWASCSRRKAVTRTRSAPCARRSSSSSGCMGPCTSTSR